MKNQISDFLNADIAYLLGLITGRGEIQVSNDIRRIVIEFKYKSLEVSASGRMLNAKLHIQTSLDKVVKRVSDLGITVQKIVTDDTLSIRLDWQHEDISWLFIKYLINGSRFSYHDFQVPDAIFEGSDAIRREFLRGVGDVTGYVRESNVDQRRRHRIYIEISNRNWHLPSQICQLNQSLGVATQNINYGHPNLRGGTGTSWAKEHQYKVYADEYESIGFYISHKDEALRELAKMNRLIGGKPNKLCNGIASRIKVKPAHEHENHEKLPNEVSGKHFDNFRQICACTGCYLQPSPHEISE